ncbi:MAG: hypothetical protein U0992_14990 [Planctomycetaceae bacterium]
MSAVWLLLAIELLLAPACTALIGTRVELPLAALALCIPQVMSSTWLLGAPAGLAVIASAALGWCLPTLLTGSPAEIDVSSIVLSTAVLIGFVMVTRQWQNSQARAQHCRGRRSAHRIAQPARVPGASKRSASQPACGIVAGDRLCRLRPLQGMERHARPRRRRPGPDRHRQRTSRPTCAATTPSRVSAATSSPFCCRRPTKQRRAASRRLMEALSTMFQARNWPLSCSVGVAVFPAPATTAEMIAAADAEMYGSKQAGGGRCQIRTILVESRPAPTP